MHKRFDRNGFSVFALFFPSLFLLLLPIQNLQSMSFCLWVKRNEKACLTMIMGMRWICRLFMFVLLRFTKGTQHTDTQLYQSVHYEMDRRPDYIDMFPLILQFNSFHRILFPFFSILFSFFWGGVLITVFSMWSLV